MAAFFAVLGATLGTAQWFVLRQQLPKFSKWIGVTALGFFIWGGIEFNRTGGLISEPNPVSAPILDIASSVTVGLLLGLLQWYHVLRHQVPKVGWWVLTTAISSLVGGVITLVAGDSVGVPLYLLVDGAITGSVLV